MCHRGVLTGFLWVLILSGHTAEKPEWAGYVKQFSVLFDASESGRYFGLPQRRLGLSSTRWRTGLKWHVAPFLRFEAAYDAIIRVQDQALFASPAPLAFENTSGYRLCDLDRKVLEPDPGGSFGILQNLDRLFLSFRVGSADVYVGRQAIAWGSGKTVNPTDVIAPFSFESLDTEDRRGVDAVRLRIPVGLLGEIDTGFLAGDTERSWANAAYMRGRGYVWQTDISMLVMQFQGHGLWGLDLARALGGAGVSLETAVVKPYLFRERRQDREKVYWRMITGCDYSFPNGWYGYLEYHFNSPGAQKAGHYLSVLDNPAYQAGKVYLFGRHYGIIGMRCQISPLWVLSSQLLWNINDSSVMAMPQVEYDLSQNAGLSGGLFYGFGEKPEVQQLLAVPETEFGMYPVFGYFSMRFYY